MEVTSKKALVIKKHKELTSHLGEDLRVTGGGTGLTSAAYSLQPVDLRKPPSDIFGPLLEAGMLCPSLPTLFLAECVFVYLSPSVSSSLINYFATTFSGNGCAGLVYEMFGLGSKFGRVMKDNLRTRGIELLGAEEATALDTQTHRFEQGGMKSSKALTLKTVRKEYITGAELKR
jgi:[phosphatase 2A protein]-leucine-carboxy methyltransferase